jgi:hypothetical protein
MLVALRSRPSNDVLLSNAVRKPIPFYSSCRITVGFISPPMRLV